GAPRPRLSRAGHFRRPGLGDPPAPVGTYGALQRPAARPGLRPPHRGAAPRPLPLSAHLGPHLRAARAAPGGRGGADVDVGWAGRALPAGGAAAARLCPGAGEAVAAPFVLPRGGTGVAAYPLTGGRVTGQSRGRQSALAPQITTHGSSPGTCPASQAAMGVAAAGSTAIRNSSHSRSRAARISGSETRVEVTLRSRSTANGMSPTREAPKAEAATESTGVSTGSPAANAACRLAQPRGSTATVSRSSPMPRLTPAARPPPPTATATASQSGASATISWPSVPWPATTPGSLWAWM